MATTKITDLTAYTDPVNTDVLPIVDVTGDVTKKVSIANVMKNASLGTAALPGIAFDGDPNTGIYSPGADQVAISTNGVQRLLISSTGAITGSSTITAGGTIEALQTFQSSSGTDVVLNANGANRDAIFKVNGTELMRLQGSTGRLGLGTSSPGATLAVDSSSTALMSTYNSTNANGGYIELRSSGTVYGDIGTAAQLVSSGSASDFCLNGRGSRGLALGTNNISRLYINSSGNVGIGTTSPVVRLHVQTSGTGTTTGSNIVASLRSEASGRDQCIQFADGTTSAYIGMLGGAIYFADAGNTERARIDSSGRLLVGTSSQSGGSLLQVNDNRIRIATAKTPASATDTGVAGEICWDANYVYVCTATNTWKRTAISTW